MPSLPTAVKINITDISAIIGVFIMVAAGIGVGFVILLFEIAYSKYENMKEKQNTIAKKAVSRWKRYVQVCACLIELVVSYSLRPSKQLVASDR